MFKKNMAVTGFTFGMINASDGSAITSGTVSGFVIIDGGIQTALTNSPVHEGNGQWSVNLTAGEMNGDVVGLVFTHASGIPVYFTIRTVAKLVSDLNDPSVAAIRSEMDANSSQLAAIVADTNELQTDDVPGLITTLNNLSIADIDARLTVYDGPTRAELTLDINSVLDKLKKYMQLLVRSDSAISTDNATELSEINTDEGSGAGNFDNTSDSTKALRDHGDAAWITGNTTPPPTAADIRNDIDANSTQLAAILEDTDELQTNNVPGLIAALNNLSTADIDARLLAYDGPTRAELTADINIVLNKLRKYVQLLSRSDVAIATDNAPELSEINADEGSGAGDYDNVTDATEAIRNHGDAAWITGGGASLTQQNIRDAMTLAASPGSPANGSIDQKLENIPASVDSQLSSAHGSGTWGSGAAGTGARTITVMVEDSGNNSPIQNAIVRMRATGMPDAVSMTNAGGTALLYVDDATYSIVVTAGGGYLPLSTSLVVDGDEGLTIQLSAVSLSAPASPALCTVGVVFKLNDQPVENAIAKAELIDKNMTVADTELSVQPVSATTDSDGRAELQLIRLDQFTSGSGKYRVTIIDDKNVKSFARIVTIPNQATAWLEDIPEA